MSTTRKHLPLNNGQKLRSAPQLFQTLCMKVILLGYPTRWTLLGCLQSSSSRAFSVDLSASYELLCGYNLKILLHPLILFQIFARRSKSPWDRNLMWLSFSSSSLWPLFYENFIILYPCKSFHSLKMSLRKKVN